MFFWIEIHENTVVNPGPVQVNFQNRPLALSTTPGLQTVCRGQHPGGQRKGKAEVVSKPEDPKTAFSLKSTSFSCLCCFKSPAIKGSQTGMCPSPSQNPCKNYIESDLWLGEAVVSMTISEMKGTVPSVSLLPLCQE